MESGRITGVVCEDERVVFGYCNGDLETGEVLVLAILPEYENLGIGKELLARVSDILFASGLTRIRLAATPDPGMRAHGFYRHLGWTPTGNYDKNGDEILQRDMEK
jgi:GNAT superfamily N-acetyltransferase